MRISLQTRLLLFVAVLLGVIQVIDLLAVNKANQDLVIERAQDDLRKEAQVLQQTILRQNEQLVTEVRIATLDFAFRQQLITGDIATKGSVTQNIAERLRIPRATLVDLDGVVEVDTTGADVADMALLKLGEDFPFLDLIDEAYDREGPATAFVSFADGAYRLVVIPIMAPNPQAFMAFWVPLDRPALLEIEGSIAQDISLAVLAGTNQTGWSLVASTLQGEEMVDTEGFSLSAGPEEVAVQTGDFGGESKAFLPAPLDSTEGSDRIVVLFFTSLDTALESTDALLRNMIAILALALVIGILGAYLVGRSIVGPVRKLAEAAREVSGGDYGRTVEVRTRDELSDLATSFNQMIHDIRSREEKISYQARFDALTGRPNRVEFIRLVDEKLAGLKPGERLGVAVINVPTIRDASRTLGHKVGDQLTLDVAQRLCQAAGTNGVVASLSNDDFGLVLKVADPDAAFSRIQESFNSVCQAFRVDDVNIDVAAHLGISLGPDHGDDANTLFRAADYSVDLARAGATATHIFDPEKDQADPERLGLMGELLVGLEQGQFQVYYQPKVDVQTGKVKGSEALVRWIHPERGFMSPDRFIPYAEQTGQIRMLTDWVLERALDDLAAWYADGHELMVAVNLSVRDLTNPALVDNVAEGLRRRNLPPEALTLEITEGALMEDQELVFSILEKLASLGIVLSIDDYGTGYSSLSYIKKLPVHELKIDKSFVLSLTASEEDDVIVRSTIDMGHNLGLSITAEGVEDEASLARLRALGCEAAQGFYMSRPVPEPEFRALVAEGRQWLAA